jgi:hypothetical protein
MSTAMILMMVLSVSVIFKPTYTIMLALVVKRMMVST